MRTSPNEGRRLGRFRASAPVTVAAFALALLAMACGETEAVKETVVVEKPVEKIVKETVVVEKPIEKIVRETVVVEKPVEKIVKETVVVDRPVEKVVVATPTSAPVAPQPIATKGPSGALVFAVGSVGTAPSGLPRDCPQCEFLPRAGTQDTLLASVRDAKGALVVEPQLAESWEIAPDLSYTDFKLRKGVQFHQNWGEMTAEDVAWTYNTANTEVTKDSVHATSAEITTDVKGAVEVIDKYTVRFRWKNFGVSTFHKVVTGYREGVGIFSKKVFDEKGAEFMRRNIISNGPFEVEEWTQFKGLFVKAVPNHYRKTPDVARIKWVEVPEAATQRAMLESEVAHGASSDEKDKRTLLKAGYVQHQEGSVWSQGLVMGGNYWVKTHPDSGTPLQRQDYSALPWVGKFGDAQSMARARNVRWALALTVDRPGIAKSIYGGAAQPAYVGGVDVNDPLMQEKIEKFQIPYDPQRAKQLLKEAGYETGFTVDFYVDAQAGSITFELTQAIAASWKQELKVETKLDQTPYATHRPNYINRTSRWIDYRTGGAFAPSNWQEEWYAGSGVSNKDGKPGGGFNSGIEIPVADQTLAKKRAAKTAQEVDAAMREYIEYMLDQMVWVGTVQGKTAGLYNPKYIAEWKMLPMAAGGGWGSYPENIVLKR